MPHMPSPTLTIVADTLYDPTGELVNGSLYISNPTTFISPDGYEIPQGTTLKFPVINGVLDFALVPNIGAIPSGTSYLVRYSVTSQDFSETWVIPQSDTPVNLTAVRVLTPPVPALMFSVNEVLPPAGMASGQVLGWNGTEWVAASAGGDVNSVFGRTGAVIALSGDYAAFYDALGAAATAQSNAESFATSAVAVETARAEAAEALLVPQLTTVNGHALSGNIVISASDLTTGTLPHAQLPTLLSGDIPNNAANTTGTAANVSGTPTLPNGTTATTQASSDSSGKLATTQFVATAVGSISVLVTSVFGRIGAVLALSGDYSVSMVTGAAPLASPALTGTPTAPTAAALTNNTRLATTAYTDSAVAVETSRAEMAEGLLASKASPTFTGTTTVANLVVSGTTSFAAGSIALAALAADTIGLTDNTGLFTISGSPATLGGSLTLSAFASQTANTVLRSGSGTPSFSALAVGDLPTTGTWAFAGTLSGNFTTTGATLQTNTDTLGLASYTAAVSNSPSLVFAGSYQSGTGTFAKDSWTISDVIGSGTNGTSTLTLAHSGTTGIAAVAAPGPIYATAGTNNYTAPALSFVGETGYGLFYFSTTVGVSCAGAAVGLFSSTNLRLQSTVALGWSTSITASAQDTGLSRSAAGVVAVGTGGVGSTAGTLAFTEALMTASLAAPTSTGTAGTAGQIIYNGTNLYLCTVTGVAGSATWNKFNLTAV